MNFPSRYLRFKMERKCLDSSWPIGGKQTCLERGNWLKSPSTSTTCHYSRQGGAETSQAIWPGFLPLLKTVLYTTFMNISCPVISHVSAGKLFQSLPVSIKPYLISRLCVFLAIFICTGLQCCPINTSGMIIFPLAFRFARFKWAKLL